MKHPDNIVNYISPDERRVISYIPFIFLCWSNSNSPFLISSSLSHYTAHGRLSLIDFIIQTCPRMMNIACIVNQNIILVIIKCTNQLILNLSVFKAVFGSHIWDLYFSFCLTSASSNVYNKQSLDTSKQTYNEENEHFSDRMIFYFTSNF